MENCSHLKRPENSFASCEGLEKKENHRPDPVEAENPSKEVLTEKNDIKQEENHEHKTMISYDTEKHASLDYEDTDNDGYQGKNSNTQNTDLHGEEKGMGGAQSTSADSQNALLSTNTDHTPYLADLNPQANNSILQPYSKTELQETEKGSGPNDNYNDDEYNEDIRDIDLETIPATPKYSEQNKDSTIFHQEDSNSIGSASVIGSSSPSIPATPGAFNGPSSSSASSGNLQTSPDRSMAVRSMRRKSSSSSRTSSPGSIKSASCSVVSTQSSPSQRKLKREGSSSPIMLRKKKKVNILSDTETESSFNSSENPNDPCSTADLDMSNKETPGLSDFENMTKRKKAEKRRLKKNEDDFVTSNDDRIAELINRMEDAAYEDRMLNKRGQPATKKVAMIYYVVSQLRKKDLQPIFLEHNILGTLKEWLSPLPSGSLPCFQIRDNILRVLADFPRIDVALIRYSGIGRILKFLQNHPGETRANKGRCSSLINEWSHPSQDHSYEYKVMTKKERELLDQEVYSKYSKQKKQAASKVLNEKKTKSLGDSLTSSSIVKASVRPGDSGWCPRARVPQPSVKDYVKRPESKLNCEIITKKKPNRLEVMMKKYQKQMRDKGTYRSASNLSIVGNKM